MALQAESIVFLFLCCLFFSNIAAQTVNQELTFHYTIAYAENPEEVQKQADYVNNLVLELVGNIKNLTSNLTNTNTTDFQTLYNLMSDINELANQSLYIQSQYEGVVNDIKKINETIVKQQLSEINSTLQCFASSQCVTAVSLVVNILYCDKLYFISSHQPQPLTRDQRHLVSQMDLCFLRVALLCHRYRPMRINAL